MGAGSKEGHWEQKCSIKGKLCFCWVMALEQETEAGIMFIGHNREDHVPWPNTS